MNKSNLFKAAHKLAKSVIKAGDNYRVTFSLAIKAILSQAKNTAINFNGLSKLSAFLKENGAEFGTAKNGKRFIEVLVDSELHTMLKDGVSLHVVEEKPSVIFTRNYEVTGFGCEYNDYLANGTTLKYTRAYINNTMTKAAK